MSVNTPNVPLPLNGRMMAIGNSSGGKCTAFITGVSQCVSMSMPPEPRNIPMATRIATRFGMMRMMTWKPSFAPSTNSS